MRALGSTAGVPFNPLGRVCVRVRVSPPAGKRIPPYTPSGPVYKPKPFPDLSHMAK